MPSSATNMSSSASPESGFTAHLLHELISSRFNDHEDNYDTFFRGTPPARESALAAFIRETREAPPNGRSLPAKMGANGARLMALMKQRLAFHLSPSSYFRNVLEANSKFDFSYRNLQDPASRELLVKLLAYRALGFRKIKLPRNTPAYWEGIERAHALNTGVPPIRIPFLTWPLHCFDTTPLGFDMRVHTYAQAIAINFVQKQYVYDRDGVTCKVESGDVVIDAGGCWGDTSLQFACAAGPEGHVYTFEFVPSNLGVMRRNIEINPHLAPRITLVQHPVGAQSGDKMFFLENGPASRVASTKVDDRYIECEILSIDRLVATRNIGKVDFIKMDVEGSELDALKGAEDTIRRFRPKLAICIYHKPDDYLTILRYLHELDLGYQFHMDHHTIFLGETVLFAVPECYTRTAPCRRKNHLSQSRAGSYSGLLPVSVPD
jgi:FkbM family methyltransferase